MTRPLPGPTLPGLPPPRTGAEVARRRGKRAQANGNAGERFAEQLHDHCAREEVAQVRRVTTNLRIVAMETFPFVRCVITGPSIVDFEGTMDDGTGRTVGVECKHIEVPLLTNLRPGALRFPLVQLPQHQRDYLAGLHARHGVAILLVVTSRGEAFALPWPAVRDVIEAGRASLDEEALAPWRVEPGRPYLARWAR